jgi:PLP dependent protein
MPSAKEIIASIPQNVSICAVTKQRSLEEVKKLLTDCPRISSIGENRWPDCEEKFQYFAPTTTNSGVQERHFIGPIQSNKINKILPLVDCIQSVDSLELLQKIQSKFAPNSTSSTLPHPSRVIKFCIQVNISEDQAKQGLSPADLPAFIEAYLKLETPNLQLTGLMTIGAQASPAERQKYFADFRQLFDQINKEYFPVPGLENAHPPLTTLSMGMSDDYLLAIKEGATMVRLGRCLFESTPE